MKEFAFDVMVKKSEQNLKELKELQKEFEQNESIKNVLFNIVGFSLHLGKSNSIFQ